MEAGVPLHHRILQLCSQHFDRRVVRQLQIILTSHSAGQVFVRTGANFSWDFLYYCQLGVQVLESS